MAPTIDGKYLEGLIFRGAKQKEVAGKKVWQAFERALTPADVLDWKDKGATVAIVTKDGRKHTVEKKAAGKKPETDKDKDPVK